MRLNRELVAIREAFARDLFKNDPKLGGPAANKAIKEKFGQVMSMKRLYALRSEVRFGQPVALETPQPVVLEAKGVDVVPVDPVRVALDEIQDKAEA